MFPLLAALTVIAISGKLVTIDKIIVPPNELPKLNSSSIKLNPHWHKPQPYHL